MDLPFICKITIIFCNSQFFVAFTFVTGGPNISKTETKVFVLKWWVAGEAKIQNDIFEPFHQKILSVIFWCMLWSNYAFNQEFHRLRPIFRSGLNEIFFLGLKERKLTPFVSFHCWLQFRFISVHSYTDTYIDVFCPDFDQRNIHHLLREDPNLSFVLSLELAEQQTSFYCLGPTDCAKQFLTLFY